ncbi:MAG: hypothetical protein KIT88_10460 [Phycisphaeraceae bacterium]|nr:hypothetical protein [Phycisphaeraceae bacterium]
MFFGIAAAFAVILIYLWSIRVFDATPVDPSGLQHESISVFVRTPGGEPSFKQTYFPGDSKQAILSEYLSKKLAMDSKVSFISYVPRVVIEAETVRINILDSQLVVSTRKSSAADWNQRVGKIGFEDQVIENWIRKIVSDSTQNTDGG